MSDRRNDRRLPPPAFPPGGRERIRGSAGPERPDGVLGPAAHPPGSEGLVFISPDEPLPMRGDGLRTEEGVVMGVGEDARYTPAEVSAAGDPHLRELTLAVTKLAEALERRGEAGLHAAPEMSRFEATLRAYCVGYLAGRRAGGEQGRVGEDGPPPHD